MVCFDSEGKIKKYATSEEILLDFYDVRMEYYHKRKASEFFFSFDVKRINLCRFIRCEHKAFLVEELSLMHDRLSNQARFIKLIISKELSINNRKRAVVVADLRTREFRPFPKIVKVHLAVAAAGGEEDDDEAEEEVVDAKGGADSDFDYLLGMALYSLTAEKVRPYFLA